MSARNRLASTALAALALTVGGLVVPSPAAADIRKLCTGYSACTKAGMSAAGYAKASSTMYWRMFSGHNCTNYAAYRLVKSGMPNVRPWTGEGNASHWGVAMKSITDQTPAVGAIAWWKANVPGAGSAGHVAYVERVISPDEIVVSQDSWGGDFSWAVVTRSGKGWPSGFIHFNDKPLLNTAAPAIDGTAKVGDTLTASAGTWNPSSATMAYQWRAAGKRIAGATAPTLTLDESLLGKRVKVRVTATQLGYPTTAVASSATPAVLPGALRSVSAPTVRGEARVDETLTATVGSWDPAPDTVALQWLADGKPIPGATGTSLALGPDLVGASITMRTTASRSGYEDVAVTSATTGPVAPGTLRLAAEPQVSGVARPGKKLEVSAADTKPNADIAVQWLRDGTPIADETGTSYRLTKADLGARVVAKVVLTRAGYEPLVVRDGIGRVKARPRLALESTVVGKKVRLRVAVTAKGVDRVEGTVKVKRGSRLVGEVTLKRGSGVTRISGMQRGKQSLTFVLPGSRSVERLAVSRTVRFR